MIGVNVESKTRCGDLGEVAELAAAAGARHEGRMHQVDTYFAVEQGRLKLREIVHTARRRHNRDGRADPVRAPGRGRGAQERVRADPVVDLTEASAARGGARHSGRGREGRELWLVDATRIHLDTVTGLGEFVELETVGAGAPTLPSVPSTIGCSECSLSIRRTASRAPTSTSSSLLERLQDRLPHELEDEPGLDVLHLGSRGQLVEHEPAQDRPCRARRRGRGSRRRP